MKEKIVTGRKEYTCVKCGKTIEKGIKHISRTIFDNGITTQREHLGCGVNTMLYVIGFFMSSLIIIGMVIN
jgi:hypothetical protein